jgi:DNA mismatch endonuclease (patch repair protein)
MGRIGPRNTIPEIAVRRVAHRLGYRFRLYRKDLPGRPDIVFPRYQLAVFVHGCFWHRHEECPNCTMPKTRPEFWSAKFCATVNRDRRNVNALHALRWRTLVIWECETETPGLVERLLLRALAEDPGAEPA